MAYVKENAVAWAKTQVGFHEGPNNKNPYSLWQYGNSYNPWCASFQCMANYMGGYRFVGCSYGEKGEAYTPTEKMRAQQQGTFRDKSFRALPGDAVLYDWGNNGLIDHVEIVLYDDGNHLITIGGNTSDSVAYRTRDRAYVAGFWALSQDVQAKPVITPADLVAIKKLLEWKKRVTENPLKFGEKNRPLDTLTLSKLLIAKGLLVKPSKVYGPAIREAVHHLKTAKKLPNTDGKVFGGLAAVAILS